MKLPVWLSRLLLAASSAAVVLLLFEVGIRLCRLGDFDAATQNQRVKNDQQGKEDVFVFYEYNDVLGWRNKASTTGFFSLVESKTHVKINSLGLRDKEYSYERQRDKKRILVLGDSMTWGYGVEQDQIFTERLEEMLGNGVEVINAGVSGYGTDQELLYFQKEGYKYKPDLLMLMVLENDFVDNNRAKRYGHTKPRFILEQGVLRLTNVPVPHSESTNQLPSWSVSQSRFYDLKKFLATHSRTYFYLTARLKANPKIANFLYKRKIARAEGIEVTKALIKELHRITQSRQCQLAVILLPYRQTFLTNTIPYAYQELTGFCRGEGIPYFNVVKQMCEYQRRTKKALSFKKHPHLNPDGHSILADFLFRYLTEQYAELFSSGYLGYNTKQGASRKTEVN